MNDNCFVYVIAGHQDAVSVAPVKIGISGNVESRLRSIQTACPFPVRIEAQILCPTRDIASCFEKILHRSQKAHNAYGEWFDVPPHRASSLLRTLADWLVDYQRDLTASELLEALRLSFSWMDA